MPLKLKKCPSCKEYTLKEKCSKCLSKTTKKKQKTIPAGYKYISRLKRAN